MSPSSTQQWTRRIRYADQNIRVSDAERNAVAEQLGAHYADGRLDQAEFDERISQTMAAKTRGDLAGLFDDLPDLGPAAGPRDGGRGRPRRPGGTLPPAAPRRDLPPAHPAGDRHRARFRLLARDEHPVLLRHPVVPDRDHRRHRRDRHPAPPPLSSSRIVRSKSMAFPVQSPDNAMDFCDLGDHGPDPWSMR